MNIDRSKIISDKSGEIEVLNVKLDDKVQNYSGVKRNLSIISLK